MEKIKKEIVLRENQYQVRPEKKSLTRYKKDQHGYFRGRFTGVPQYFSDEIKYIQLKKDINTHGIHLKKGEIVGRLKRYGSLPHTLTINVKTRKRR